MLQGTIADTYGLTRHGIHLDTSMNNVVAAVRSAGAIRPEERVAAGSIGAVVWVIASASVIGLALVLPAHEEHRTTLVLMGLGGVAWGAFSGLVLDYSRLPVWLIHLSTAAGAAAIAVAIWLSGGARSPAWACLFYVVVFAAYFLKPQAAAAYFAACVAVVLIVALGASSSARAGGTASLVVAAPAFVVLGAAIVVGKRYMWSLRRQAEQLAAEQGALRRVATAVVSGETADHFYELVSVEAGHLLGASGAAVLRLEDGAETTVLGSWSEDPDRRYPPGARFPVAGDSDLAKALSEGRTARILRPVAGGSVARLGYASSMVTPIRVDGRTWGFLAVVSVSPEALTAEHEDRLTEFGNLIATSITNIEDRAALTAQAATDALTGVANHRAFHDRLTADLARARRYGTPVSVAMIDVDRFKLVNDAGGHEAGDEMLIRVARCLSHAARTEDTLARVGGDEFAWILPETSGEEAVVAVQRASDAISAAAQLPRVTISAGVCDSGWTADPTELVRLADRALYSSKDHGRDQVRLYVPSSTDELAAH
jgi:diguanylate cyclase (GGDEF)-like protein